MVSNSIYFDVIVVGGGHAGTESALAASRMNMKVLLLTHSIYNIGCLSCNPSIGGIGKSHLVKEIDALGGIMAIAADYSGIHAKILNVNKGPAVRSTRIQVDRKIYKNFIYKSIINQKKLVVLSEEVIDLIIKNNCVIGVKTAYQNRFYSKSVVLTTGTFLKGKIHIGLKNFLGGRINDKSSIHLSDRLKELPIKIGRLKTGTPPRIDIRTINFTNLLVQNGDIPRPFFSIMSSKLNILKQVSCYITYTNEKTHDIIRKNLHYSPMYSGNIIGLGPRYCPSIEDKIIRFPDKLSHQIFIEPEGLECISAYPNGISTSLPLSIQKKFIRSIYGFELAKIIKPGYAVEYDFFDPIGLKLTLESKFIGGLFFAGQINGTTGYEEAAAQGILSGINASLYALNITGWYPRRNQAYLGVLIDDLCTKGTKEPYRMFTSRAEHRLILREDNADLRLTKYAKNFNLINLLRWKKYQKKIINIKLEKIKLNNMKILKNSILFNKINKYFNIVLKKDIHILDVFNRPECTIENILKSKIFFSQSSDIEAIREILINIKYKGYILKQQKEIIKQLKYENFILPSNFDYNKIVGLSNEVICKLNYYQPCSIGQAFRISGITPSAISILLIYFKKSYDQ